MYADHAPHNAAGEACGRKRPVELKYHTVLTACEPNGVLADK